MSNYCDSPCSHTHIKYDIPCVNLCDSPCGHTHIKYDIPRCQNSVTHHAVTHILNMPYLDVILIRINRCIR